MNITNSTYFEAIQTLNEKSSRVLCYCSLVHREWMQWMKAIEEAFTQRNEAFIENETIMRNPMWMVSGIRVMLVMEFHRRSTRNATERNVWQKLNFLPHSLPIVRFFFLSHCRRFWTPTSFSIQPPRSQPSFTILVQKAACLIQLLQDPWAAWEYAWILDFSDCNYTREASRNIFFSACVVSTSIMFSILIVSMATDPTDSFWRIPLTATAVQHFCYPF